MTPLSEVTQRSPLVLRPHGTGRAAKLPHLRQVVTPWAALPRQSDD